MATKPGKKRMSQSEVVNHFAEKYDLKRAQVKELFEELSNSTHGRPPGGLACVGYLPTGLPTGRQASCVANAILVQSRAFALLRRRLDD